MVLKKNIYGHNKIVGTLLPLTALIPQSQNEENGTFPRGSAFIEWLYKTGQHAWQMLPLHQTQLIPGKKNLHVPSPYKGYGIGLDPRFLDKKTATRQPSDAELVAFLTKHSTWIGDYALFCSLRDHFGTDDWTKWEKGIQTRNYADISLWKEKLADKIEAHIRTQWQLHEAYSQLHNEAGEKKILLIGDISYYLSMRSPMVWKFQHLFEIDEKGNLPRVSGMPDSPKAIYGRQVWGHPLYRWNITYFYKDIIDLWKLRLGYAHQLFDIVRLDHANGFFQYGSIDQENEGNDEIVKGPGLVVFNEIVEYCEQAGIHLIAEDAGEELHELRDALQRFQIPGIRVLRCGIDEKRNKIIPEYAKPDTYPENSIAYTSTHDTETLAGFLAILNETQKKELSVYAKVEYSPVIKTLAARFRNAALHSPAHTVIISLQDWLLETERINVPGTETEQNDPNWQYMVDKDIASLPEVTTDR